MKELSKEALQLLSTKSVSEEGNEDLINLLIPILERMNAKLILQQVPHSLADHSKRQFNLIGILGDDLVDSRTKKGLLLTAHTDTTNPGNKSDWVSTGGDPFNPMEKDGRVFGLGAANAKMDLYAKLRVCELFAKQNLKQPLYFAATCGAESALAGVKYLIQSGVVNPKQVLVGHPTDLRLVHAQKSQLTFYIRLSFVAIERDAQEYNTKIYLTARRPSGDVALHPHAENALTKMLGLMERVNSSRVPAKVFAIQAQSGAQKMPDIATVGLVIPSQEFEPLREKFRSFFANNQGDAFEMRFGGTGDRGIKILPADILPAMNAIIQEVQAYGGELGACKDDAFSLASSTATVNSLNQERDYLSFSVQFQLVPELSSVEKKREIEKAFRERLQNLLKAYPTLSLECRKLVSSPRYFADPNSALFRTLGADLERSGTVPMVDTTNTSSEAGYFQEKGFDVAVFGPGGEQNQFHGPNEFVDLQQIDAAIRFYSQAVETFCVRGI